MRMICRAIVGVFVLVGVWFSAPACALAQDDQFLLPEQSAAKAKQVLQRAIDSLGGPAYLSARESACTGHVVQFDLGMPSPLGDYLGFNDIREWPDKARTEYFGKSQRNALQALVNMDAGELEFTHGGIAITIYNGDHGWSYDKSGVNELPAGAVADFHARMNANIDNILRFRISEPGMVLRYGGQDIVDRKEAEWVELTDADNQVIRIAFAGDTHLPIRKTMDIRDPSTQLKGAEVEIYSNYHPMGGIQTPLRTARERNGKAISETYYDKCEYTSNPSEAQFSKASLDQKAAQSREKEKTKGAKVKKSDKNKDTTLTDE
jgi:hypothetical protein